MKNTILITGASAGIGRAIATTIAKEQPHTTLILTGRNVEKLNETKSHLRSKQNHKVFAVDMASHQSIRELKQKLETEKVTLSGLVLNAGIGGENHYGENDRWDEIIATNLTGPYQLSQELLPFIRTNESEFKHIVFLSSILGRIGVPAHAAYCASKAGLLGLMRSMAVEYAQEKILVNAICPGWVDTEMSKQGIEGIAAATGMTLEQTFHAVMTQVPLKKMARPEEIAEVVQFLVSEKQTSITGQSFDVNNGALMP